MDINEIDEKDFSFSITVAIKLQWQDDRILNPINGSSNNGHINVDLGFANKIWKPDFYFYDLQSFRMINSFQQPQGGLRIKRNEYNLTEVFYMVEAEIVFTCPINYSDFPFHRATCKLRFSSFNERSNSMIFTSNLEKMPPGQVLDQDKIRGYMVNVSYLCGEDTRIASWSNPGSSYSVVGIKIDLVSSYRKYIFVYFIPTSMFTITSWVSYLLPPTSYPARTSLLVTVFLCQVGIFTAAIKDTPNFDGGKIFH